MAISFGSPSLSTGEPSAENAGASGAVGGARKTTSPKMNGGPSEVRPSKLRNREGPG
jgi:hypothetical protein